MRALMVAGWVVAFAAGHKVARRSSDTQDRESASHSPRETTAGFDAGFRESLTQAVAGATSWQEVKARVMGRWEASPSVSVDFELRDETLRMLEKAPDADLEAWRMELRLVEEDAIDHDKNVPLMLREMILKVLARRGGGEFIRSLAATTEEDGKGDVADAMEHWMERDPVAVMDWLDGEVPEVIADDVDDYREDAVRYWTKRDPAAALDWLGGEVPKVIAGDLADYREDALMSLMMKDPAEFERRLSQVDAEVREMVLDDYAWMNGTAEGRDGLLARAAGSPHEEAMALWSGLIRREGDDDPARAYATLRELDVSEEDRAELDERLMYSLLHVGRFSSEKIDGIGVMRAWAARNPGDEVSKRTLESFGRWSESDPDQAAAWVGELPDGGRYDAFAKTLMKERIEKHEATAGMIARIGDGDIRAAMQRQLKESWVESDADAAAEWERGLPEEDRERLGETVAE